MAADQQALSLQLASAFPTFPPQEHDKSYDGYNNNQVGATER
jgi:hypothetical protein